jgi:UDP-sugar pyrophosphorylase
MEIQNEFQAKCFEILKECSQTELIKRFEEASEDEKDIFAEQVVELDSDFPGGLSEYCERARALLYDSKNGKNPFEGFIPSVPTGIKVETNSSEFHELEAIGLEQLSSTCFVLVAGGLGERLGYSSIKVGLPLTLLDKELCYLKYYCEYIKAFEVRALKTLPEDQRQEFMIPLCIMTSGDTHEKTISLLELNNNFGLRKDQVSIVKQEKVPALMDNNATFSVKSDKLEIETKPHGHGDVHTLLHQNGVTQRWQQLNKKWIVFFQDTNALVFKAIPSALGVSTQRDFDVNSICVARKPGDAMGGMATLTNTQANKKITINVEYNQLEPLLKETWNEAGDVADEDGNSFFPGNINVLVYKLSTYLDTLNRTSGLIPEFVNPKYKDSSRDVFKSATRLECMMQDFPKLLNKDAKVGFSCYERWFCFSAVKNNIVDAALKFKQGLHPECGSTGEYDIFDANARVLKLAGASIEGVTESDVKDFNGIKIKDGAKIFIHPSFAVTLRELQDKIIGYCKISKKSVLWLEGENTYLKDLELDSTLITGNNSEEVEGEFNDQKYIEYVPLNSKTEDIDAFDEIVKIRGFKLSSEHQISSLNFISN